MAACNRARSASVQADDVLSGATTASLGKTGNYIEVVDRAGAQYSSISNNRSGASVLDPKSSAFTIELFFDVPKELNDNQVIFHC